MQYWRMALTLSVALFMSASWAGGTLEEFIECDPDAKVSIDNVAGKVTVSTWDRSQIRFFIRAGDGVQRVDFSRSRSHPGVEIVLKGRMRGGLDAGCDIEVQCPPGVSLEVECISAGIEVRGIHGELDLSTVSGRVTVNDARDDVEIETVSGSVAVQGRMGDLKVSTTSGGVDVEGNADNVDIETVSGSIEVLGDVDAARLHTTSSRIFLKGNVGSIDAESVSAGIEVDQVHRDADIATMSGSIRVLGSMPDDVELESFSSGVSYDGGIRPGGRLDVSTKSGSIKVALPENIGATFDLSTLSGSIRNEFPGAPATRKGLGPGKELEFSVGDGRTDVELETLSSGIQLRMLPPMTTNPDAAPALLEESLAPIR